MIAGYEYIMKTGLVTDGKGLFLGIQFATDTDGEGVTVYDGLDIGSGRVILSTPGWQHDPNIISLPAPIPFYNGLYVVFDAGVTNATIFLSTQRGDYIQPEGTLRTILEPDPIG